MKNKRNFNPFSKGYSGKKGSVATENITIESGIIKPFEQDITKTEKSDKYHQDKADRQEAQEQLQLARMLARAERYETYLELKEEFEDGEK